MQTSRTNEEILAIVARAWSTRPDWRLCQLIYNAMRDDPSPLSLYDYENDDLAERLIAYCGLDVTVPELASRNELAGEWALWVEIAKAVSDRRTLASEAQLRAKQLLVKYGSSHDSVELERSV